jgi:membrane-bound lytic murein transglycosylase B
MTMEPDRKDNPSKSAKLASRRWARRAMLSALAGGGLTAAGLSGPLAAGALGAEAGSTGPSDTPPTPVSGASGEAGGSSQGSGEPTTTTTTTSAAAPTTTTTTTTAATPTPAPAAPSTGASQPASAPAIVVQRKQQTTPAKPVNRNLTKTTSGAQKGGSSKGAAKTKAKTKGAGKNSQDSSAAETTGPNGVALAPQVIAGQPDAFGSVVNPATMALSAQALSYYRIPLFLLPIYQAAAIQYGVPWQILAAINEVETNYGTDLSVSTAGAVGWMQFEPQTWQQYGVDATGAGNADPYNPVDAIFAAARYLRAAGAAKNLNSAILAYNHSDAYVSSVLLRAKLISSYPESVIATLTGLTEGRPPIAGFRVASSGKSAAAGPPDNGEESAATASAPTSTSPAATSPAATPDTSAASSADATANAVPVQSVPGSAPAPTPTASAAQVKPSDPRLVNLMAAKNAAVVAVQDGRVVKIGHSRKLGSYVILRDVYGDLFTYAELGNIASTYRLPDLPSVHAAKHAQAATSSDASAASLKDPAPRTAATAGHQPPVTLSVKTHAKQVPSTQATVAPESGLAPPGLLGKVRLFAHPDSPDALAAAARASSQAPRTDAHGGRWLALRKGSVVTQGTVLGHTRVPTGARYGHMLFSIKPAGDSDTVDPRPILHNWKELDTALHPRGAKASSVLSGATAAEVFLLPKSQLEREVLSDPGIEIYACGRQDIASGAIDSRVLAVLAFLSRSGLKPTVSALRCGHSEYTTSGNVSEHYSGDAVDISAINGIPIAGHQGAGTITDTTIRTLLTLQGRFVPHQIISLMQYPGAANTLAMPEHWNHIHIGFRPVGASVAPSPAAAATAAHSAASGKAAPSPLIVTGDLSPSQWNQLIARIGALPTPTVTQKPSKAAIRDPQAAPSNRDLGAHGLPTRTELSH